ncbi:hypothetical protein HDC90_002568 [Pedobacter sp. AK013]|uniref:putative zinc-binding metallopeptidase n=1 Tax=Pedobacter sp. AK013 TaxID=2723071 RepID=UPI001620884E|nr:putative zinc-binding metallopeptidase [Pedobacter sp. AK013]MBB6237942.1 hypothetical protein [Pedobacter sp. AK013]
MKNYLNIFLLIAIFAGVSSCKKAEESLTPSGVNMIYTLPQGNNSFDQTIVNYYNNYGSYLLYKFTERDAYWTPTGWRRPTPSDAPSPWTGTDVAAADPNAVAAQLDLLDKSLFKLYPKSFLKEFMPVKLLLCSKVDSIYTTYVFTPVYTPTRNAKKIPAFYSYDNIYINYGDATVNQMSAAEKLFFLARVNQVFFQSINDRGLIKATNDFILSADYSSSNASQAVAYGKGIVGTYISSSATTDWAAYVMAMVTLSEADLNRSVPNTNTSLVGILNPTKDTNGLIKKRYNLVRNYFINTYQVDPQVIGNKSRGL